MRLRLLSTALAMLLCVTLSFNAAEAAMTDTPPMTQERINAIVPIAAHAAMGEMERLQTSLAAGLDAGLTVNEIKEILVQLYAYAGFPRSLNALGAFMTVLEERKAQGVEDAPGRGPSPLPPAASMLETGTANQTKLSGTPVRGPLFEFAPAIDQFLKAHLFGDIFARDNLDWPSREVATIAILSSISGLDSQLGSHLNIGMNTGLTPDQLRMIVSALREYVGQTEADNAAAELQRVLTARKK